MAHKVRNVIWAFAFCGLGFAAVLYTMRPSDAAPPKPAMIASKIVGWEEAQVSKADWGEMRRYFTGETSGSKNVLTAVAVVEPGKAVHKSHRHAEEEYLVLVDGAGTWSLAGKETPAKRGDVLYAEPWVFHGLKNTGEKALIFLVVRYSSKGVPLPPKPDDKPDEM